MSKFKKKKEGGLPPVSTASLPDIVFMLLFFFMVATVLRKNQLIVLNQLPPADQVEKLDKNRTVYIYAGKPGAGYGNLGSESIIQIGDKIVNVDEIQPAILEEREKLRDELKDKVIVALKVDKEAKQGVVADAKKELREANLPKILYIATPGNAANQ